MERWSGKGKIFEPIKIGTITVPNRIVAAPFCSRLADADGFVTPELIDYWHQRAVGGVGMVILEAAAIDRECSRLERNQLAAYSDDCHVGLAVLAEAIQTHGARAILQLAHAGRQTMPPALWGKTPLAPSAIPCPYMSMLMGEPNPTREITVEEIHEVTASFMQAAARARLVGFDGIELHFAHGYLVASFLSPRTNKRNDEYGGSLENRARFGLDILQACRAEVGDGFPIGVRMSGDEFLDDGFKLEESQIFAQWLEAAGADYLHVSASNYETVEMQCSTTYQSHGLLVSLAEAIKARVKVPVITVGSITAELATDIIDSGKADLVAIGRGLNADPHLARKMAEGREDEIIPCIRCNRCVESEGQERPTRCETNFLTGRRLQYPITWLPQPRKVLVIGGGPGGMEAARVAALRGCRVSLYDQKPRLGGALLAASVPQFMDDVRRLIEYYEGQLRRLDVQLYLDSIATPDLVQQEQPDTLILALGGKPMPLPKAFASDGGHAVYVEDALLGQVDVGEKLLILGGNYISCQAAAHFAQEGRHVTLASSRTEPEQLGAELETICRSMLVRLLDEQNVELLLGHRLSEVAGDRLLLNSSHGPTEVAADRALLSLGYLPRKDEIAAYQGLAPRMYAIGDCVRPRRIGPAIHEGFVAGYEA